MRTLFSVLSSAMSEFHLFKCSSHNCSSQSVRSLQSTPATNESNETRHEDFYIFFIKRRKANKPVYKKLISMKANSPEESQIKWDANCESGNCYKPDWKNAHNYSFSLHQEY